VADKSAIEWTDASWNPVTGCSKVSPGCAHCYAETLSLRFGWSPKPWTPENAEENVILHPERLDAPLRWKRPRTVFVNSMSDLFHELVPDDFVAQVFDVMAEASRHTFQVLTKRPERARDLMRAWLRHIDAEPDSLPLPNVWLGVSIENSRYTWRADVLREIPAAVRFISAEPLLGSLFEPEPFSWPDKHDWQPIPSNTASAEIHPKPGAYHCARCGSFSPMLTLGDCPGEPGVKKTKRPLDLSGIDWLIVGGESGGRDARPMHPAWARELRDACLAFPDQRVAPAFFFKQWGSHDEDGVYRGAGPKNGGRLLDGREWNEMPNTLVTA